MGNDLIEIKVDGTIICKWPSRLSYKLEACFMSGEVLSGLFLDEEYLGKFMVISNSIDMLSAIQTSKIKNIERQDKTNTNLKQKIENLVDKVFLHGVWFHAGDKCRANEFLEKYKKLENEIFEDIQKLENE